MDKRDLISYLKSLDQELKVETELCVYGSGALILMDEPGRTSLDLDVAAPYSKADYGDLERAGEMAGLPLNPDESYPGEHIEWISSLRLCLVKPDPENTVVLWRGKRLTIITVSPEDLVASKLIRYDETDQADILFLCTQSRLTYQEITSAVRRLPRQFSSDTLVLDNLINLKTDLALWFSGE